MGLRFSIINMQSKVVKTRNIYLGLFCRFRSSLITLDLMVTTLNVTLCKYIELNIIIYNYVPMYYVLNKKRSVAKTVSGTVKWTYVMRSSYQKRRIRRWLWKPYRDSVGGRSPLRLASLARQAGSSLPGTGSELVELLRAQLTHLTEHKH